MLECLRHHTTKQRSIRRLSPSSSSCSGGEVRNPPERVSRYRRLGTLACVHSSGGAASAAAVAPEHVVEGGPEGGAHQEVDGEVDRGVQDLLRGDRIMFRQILVNLDPLP